MIEVEYLPILGETLMMVEKTTKFGEDSIVFTTSSGVSYKMFHEQQCCEEVYIEDVTGDLKDLVGAEITMAEVYTEEQDVRNTEDGWLEPVRFTFYKFATNLGYVTIRWYGTSNGYYSTRVSFEKQTSNWSDIF